MKQNVLLKVALVALLCTPPPEGPGSWLMHSAKAQSEVWVLGDQWVRTGTSNAVLPLQALPQPGGAGNYAGQLATRSSTARADASGNLLFFAIDGNFYNGQGYRIADAEGIGCVQCVPKGHSEILVLPVPGSCWLYYVVSVRSEAAGSGYTVIASILDMRADISVAPCAKGRMLNVDDLPDIGGPYDQFHDWFFSGDGYADNEHQKIVSTLFDSEEDAGYVSMAAMDPGWANGELLLHITTDRTVHQYRVTATGIQASWNHLIEPDHVFYKELTRDTDFGRDELTGDILFATTDDGLWIAGEPQNAPSYRALVLRMDAATGDVLETEGYLLFPGLDVGSLSDGTNGPYSCSFSPDGQKLYFTGDFIGLELGVIDRITGIVTDLTDLANLGITGPTTWARTRLSRGKAPGGVEDAIFFAKSTGLAALVSPNNPATATWNASVGFSTGLNGIPVYVDPFVAGTPTCILMDALIAADQHSTTLALVGACCEYMSEVYAECEYSFSGNNSTTPWTVANNGFLDPDDNGEILFAHDYVVQPGAQLSLDGMTLRFAPSAHLIIKPGGRARFQNCTLTSFVCDGSRWKGIRVNGTTSADQTPIIGGPQGFLQLVNTTVSNAKYGLRCATEFANGSTDPTGYGGIVYAYSGTTFRNNIYGAELGNYHRPAGMLDDNRCYFSTCHFVTDNAWPDAELPATQLVVQNTRKIAVSFCSFANDAPQLFAPDQWGTGMRVYNAEVSVLGGTNTTDSFVRNLRRGIVRSGPDPTIPFTVDHMRFSGNVTGIWDVGTYYSKYVNNTFSVPDQNGAPNKRIGLHLQQSHLYTVERNSFTGQDAAIQPNENSIGIFFKGIAPAANAVWNYEDNQIYDNTFENLYAATLVNDVHVSNDGFNDNEGLQILCGDYSNNVLDIALGPKSPIRSDQGEGGGSDPQLAGNRFYGNANCNDEYDYKMDPNWNNIQPFTTTPLDYHRHEDPLCDILCEPQPYLWDDPLSDSGPLDKVVDCGYGSLDAAHGVVEAHGLFVTARDLAVAANNLLEGLTDGGERPDLLADLAQDSPWLGTSFLRDELMLHSPLSNRVLEAVIEREQPMDPWHIAQVMLENTPLNQPILSQLHASNVLGDFFYNVVAQAQEGEGASAKQLLEQELVARRRQQARFFAELGWLWATDTVNPGGDDSLRAVFMNDAGLHHKADRMAYWLANSAFENLGAELETADPAMDGLEEMRYVLGSGEAHNGDWSLLDSVEMDSLVRFAEKGGQFSAQFAALLWVSDHTDLEPEPVFPDMTKRMISSDGAGIADNENTLRVFPIPADEHALLTFPPEWKGESLYAYDATGRALLNTQLEQAGLHELNTALWPPGVYQLVVGHVGAVLRLVVKR